MKSREFIICSSFNFFQRIVISPFMMIVMVLVLNNLLKTNKQNLSIIYLFLGATFTLAGLPWLLSPVASG